MASLVWYCHVTHHMTIIMQAAVKAISVDPIIDIPDALKWYPDILKVGADSSAD